MILEEKLGHTETPGAHAEENDHMKTQQKGGHLQAKNRSFWKINLLTPWSDLQPQNSEKIYSYYLSHPISVILFWSPSKLISSWDTQVYLCFLFIERLKHCKSWLFPCVCVFVYVCMWVNVCLCVAYVDIFVPTPCCTMNLNSSNIYFLIHTKHYSNYFVK